MGKKALATGLFICERLNCKQTVGSYSYMGFKRQRTIMCNLLATRKLSLKAHIVPSTRVGGLAQVGLVWLFGLISHSLLL